MSYDLIKNGLKELVESLGLAPSESLDFQDVGSNEMGYSYILKPVSGTMDRETSETLVDRFHDIQEWQIQVAQSKSSHSDVINLDNLNRKRDEILKKIDKPSNWTSFVRLLRYSDWTIEEEVNYLLLSITVEIIDTITY